MMSVSLFAAIVSLLLSLSFGADHDQRPLQEKTQKPNILFILTDDQDVQMGSLDFMPYLKEHIIDRGLTFNRHYCTVALCCPSRVSLWTGKAAHNTNVTDLNPPYGGYPKFVSQGFNENYLPIWLQEAGYNTYYVGKFLNAQSTSNYDSPHAAGWTGSNFLLDPYTYRYLNATFQRNHDKPVSYEGQYATDILAEKAYGFLDDALDDLKQNDNPFFLTVAPIAPHSDVNINRDKIDDDFKEDTNIQAPPVPAERHKHLFKDEVVPRTPNFNPNHSCGVSWIGRLPKQSQENIDFNDEWHRNRLRTLQAVDEMIDALVNKLDAAGILDNTYVLFSSDNGYTIGQHRRQPGKQCAFEQDINVPMIVRGPGIAEGIETDMVTSHTDLAPTILRLAGAQAPENFVLDGQAIPLMSGEGPSDETPWRQEHVNVEMWGIIMAEGKYGAVLYPNHTYKALRIQGSGYSFLYTVWCGGEHELYDMQTDPYQIDNLLDSTRTPLLNDSMPLPEAMESTSEFSAEVSAQVSGANIPVSRLVYRLDALLMVLKTCKGRQCTHPWETLFPDGQVGGLVDALNESFDAFFEFQVSKVRYEKCEKGYIPESEGPMWSNDQAYGMFHEMAFE